MTAKNDITGDLIKSKPSNSYSDNYDAIFRKEQTNTTEQINSDEVGGGKKAEAIG